MNFLGTQTDRWIYGHTHTHTHTHTQEYTHEHEIHLWMYMSFQYHEYTWLRFRVGRLKFLYVEYNCSANDCVFLLLFFHVPPYTSMHLATVLSFNRVLSTLFIFFLLSGGGWVSSELGCHIWMPLIEPFDKGTAVHTCTHMHIYTQQKKKVNTYCTLIISYTNPINSQWHISN